MDRQIGVGVGCGYWGPNLIRNFAKVPHARVTAVADIRFERAANVGGEFRINAITDDPRELIARDDVSMVIVATPSCNHFELAKLALLAGKHVLVMKPLTTRVDHAEELVDLAERQGVILAVDHTFVYTGAVQKMREMVASGEFGDIYYVDSVRINLGLFQPDVNVIWDLAPHDVSIIDYVLGGTLPTEVSAIGACHAGSPMENIAYLTMRYGPSTLAHIHVNWLAPAKIRRTIVGGSKRMAVYDDMDPSEKVKIYDKGVTITPSSSPSEVYGQLVSYRSGDMHAPRLSMQEALAVEAEHLLTCIRTGATPTADGHAGLRTVRILEAAQRSICSNSTPVRLPGVAAEVASASSTLPPS
jgi:predicted dehydrogenase